MLEQLGKDGLAKIHAALSNMPNTSRPQISDKIGEFEFKALPRVEAGNDLNSNSPILSEIWGREVLGMFATMPHESWPNRLFPIAPASTSQTISKVRSSLWRRFLREEPLLLGSVPCHGVRTTDLPREPA